MTTNYAHGHDAEQIAADYLKGKGFQIVELNWKTRYCEVDIVADKDDVVYLVEVKYRKTNTQGGGLDYITPKKLGQMQFAAELWVSNHDWQGEYQLAALEVSGEDFAVTDFITDVAIS